MGTKTKELIKSNNNKINNITNDTHFYTKRNYNNIRVNINLIRNNNIFFSTSKIRINKNNIWNQNQNKNNKNIE